jgi:uncharacterized membrane protein YgdD (TMEM256/DUF423 family)
MDRVFLALGALSAFVGVAAGAFGAHALRRRLSAEMLAVFEIGVRYQMYHALALLVVAIAFGLQPNGLLTISGWCFVLGTIVFSGSLYALSLSGKRWLGAITPIGGIAFLAGWLSLLWFAIGALG